MIAKKIRTLGLTAALLFAASSAMASGLSLKTINMPANIKVSCNGKTLPQEIGPNNAVSDIPWFVVVTAFGGAETLNCDFLLNDAGQEKVGSATLLVSLLHNQGEAANVHPNPGYAVSILPGENTYSNGLTVSIQMAPGMHFQQ